MGLGSAGFDRARRPGVGQGALRRITIGEHFAAAAVTFMPRLGPAPKVRALVPPIFAPTSPMTLPAPWRTLLRVLAFVVVAVSGGAAAHQLLIDWQKPLLQPARYQAQSQPAHDGQPALAPAPALAAIVAPVGALVVAKARPGQRLAPAVVVQALPKRIAVAVLARGPPLPLF
jgi:hypothetical protein